MRIKDFLAARDEAIKARFLSTLPQDDEALIEQVGEILDEAFRQGGQDWEKKYIDVFFPDRAEELRKTLQEGAVFS